MDVDEAIRKLNSDLCNIVLWSKNNSLLLNPTKTKYIVFGSKHQLANFSPSVDVELMDAPVERVYEARNLGLYMDCNLRFEKHVSDTVANCFYRLKVLYRMRSHIQMELRIRLVESLILSKLNYSDTVISPRLLARTQKLIQRVQNACARFCFDIPLRGHVTPFLNQHGIMKMRHRRKLHLACLLFGVLKHQVPSYLYEKLSWMGSTRSCGLRQSAKQLSMQRHSSASFRGSFRYAASRCWNNIPPPIRNLQSFNGFKLKLRKFMFEGQKGQESHRNDTSII